MRLIERVGRFLAQARRGHARATSVDAAAVAALHALVAAWQYARGLRIAPLFSDDPWDWWQTIPVVDLLDRPWSSLLLDHAQPPGFSLWGWVWLQAFGPERFVYAMQAGYVALGMAVCATTYDLTRLLTGSRRWGVAAGAAMALNPALLLYEAYPLYEALVVFLLTASLWTLARSILTRRGRWLAAAALALNALVMTRSLYHWVFLIGTLAWAWPLWRRLRPAVRWGAFATAIALPGVWYAKNAALYGFFGGSSWFGLSWFKCVMQGFSYQELVQFKQAGLIPAYVQERYPFQHSPSQYRAYGFTATTSIPLFARDDFRNINLPAIARGYEHAARTLALRYPLRYARAVLKAYGRFCVPPSRYYQLDTWRVGHVGWEPFVAQWLYGSAITDAIEIPTRFDAGSLFFLYFPVLMIGGGLWACRRRRRDASRALAMGAILWACGYVAAVGTAFEFGENMRFRFATEPASLAVACTLLHALGVARRAHPSASAQAAHAAGGPPSTGPCPIQRLAVKSWSAVGADAVGTER